MFYVQFKDEIYFLKISPEFETVNFCKCFSPYVFLF